jgi:hypothetical protein
MELLGNQRPDAQLIASCITTHGTQIWTIDALLGRVAESLGLRAANFG